MGLMKSKARKPSLLPHVRMHEQSYNGECAEPHLPLPKKDRVWAFADILQMRPDDDLQNHSPHVTLETGWPKEKNRVG